MPIFRHRVLGNLDYKICWPTTSSRRSHLLLLIAARCRSKLSVALLLTVFAGCLLLPLNFIAVSRLADRHQTAALPSENGGRHPPEVMSSWTAKLTGPEAERVSRLFARWRRELYSTCDGRLVAFSGEFVRMRSVIVDRKRWNSMRKGGEPIDDVMGQDSWVEYYRFGRGGFRLAGCRETSNITPSHSMPLFDSGNYINDWLTATEIEAEQIENEAEISHVTFAVMRDEYANIYHTMSDWVNVFLMTQFFHLDPTTVRILWMDSHPSGPLDAAWSVLFPGGVSRLSDLDPGRTLFQEMVWIVPGHRGPFEQHFAPRLALVEHFRRLVIILMDGPL